MGSTDVQIIPTAPSINKTIATPTSSLVNFLPEVLQAANSQGLSNPEKPHPQRINNGTSSLAQDDIYSERHQANTQRWTNPFRYKLLNSNKQDNRQVMPQPATNAITQRKSSLLLHGILRGEPAWAGILNATSRHDFMVNVRSSKVGEAMGRRSDIRHPIKPRAQFERRTRFIFGERYVQAT